MIFGTDATYKFSSSKLKQFSRYSRHLIFTERRITLAIFDALPLKVHHLKISCPQERAMNSITIMAESKKGHNFVIQGPTEKNMGSLIFCTDAIYKIL